MFTVGLSKPLNQELSVDFTTADGTAIAGVDYDAVSGTLIFAAGDTTQTVVVPVIGDMQGEFNETFFVNLSNVQIDDLLTTFIPLDALSVDGVEGRLFGLDVETDTLFTLDAVTGAEISRALVPMDLDAAAALDFNTVSGDLVVAVGSAVTEINLSTGVETTYDAPETISGVGLVGDRLFVTGAGDPGIVYELNRDTGTFVEFFAFENGTLLLGAAGGPAREAPDPGSTFTVMVNNVAPVFDVLTNSAEVPGAVLPPDTLVTLTSTFIDPGSLDIHDVTVDWGDGTAPTTETLAAVLGGSPSTTTTPPVPSKSR